ncbi:hypothetical protein [Paraburkholderia unamae]|uniref:EpsG-like glucosyltransferase n=1 Tax=Paraburkholderia unamae TaxID=219649 RepID=A0ABX5KNZ2_9BURK|nr:hypothetical protein [Paraburkholderia unamae]PVX82248.1 hypothetical protein C7402_109101 [Paraburkholderia unamae]CAG9272226.1 conserved membrane hypothetical protein [Paraburkholderia unamae]
MKRVNLWIVLALMGVGVALVWGATANKPESLNWSGYGYTDWLITYDHGFVRRGLGGELLGLVREKADWISAINHLVFVNYTVLCVLLFALWRASRWQSTPAILLALLLPGGLVHMALGGEYFFRKEMLFHISLAIDCLLYISICRAGTDARRLPAAWLFFVVFLAQCVALPLVHEGFVFISFPAFYLLARRVAQMLAPTHLTFTWLVRLGLFIQLVMLGVCFLWRGSPQLASEMWMTLDPALRALLSPKSPDIPFGAVTVLGWSTLANLAMSLHVVVSGQFWEWAVGAIGISAVLAFITSRRDASAGVCSPDLLRRHLAILWFLALCSIPIFILAMDWGRWLSAVALSYLMLLLADGTGSITTPDVMSRVPAALRARLEPCFQYVSRDLIPAIAYRSGRHGKALFFLSLFYCLTFRLPECCMLMGFSPFYRFRPLIDQFFH